MGLDLSVTLVHVLTRCTGRRRQENEPLFDGKELKPVELQLILDYLKVCIFSKPELTGCDIWVWGIWRGRHETGAT